MRFSARPSCGTHSGQFFEAAITSGSARSSARIGERSAQRRSRSLSLANSSRVLATNRSSAFSVFTGVLMIAPSMTSDGPWLTKMRLIDRVEPCAVVPEDLLFLVALKWEFEKTGDRLGISGVAMRVVG